MNDSENGRTSDAVAAAIASLEPIVHWLISQGVSAYATTAITKNIYVQVAKNKFGSKGRPAANTRVEMLTGIDRKDVQRILQEGNPLNGNSPVKLNQNRQNKITRILSTWLEDPTYLQVNGKPRRLRLRSGEPNLTSLVNKFAKDLRSNSVIKAMLDAGSIRKTGSGYYEVLTRNYIPLARGREQVLRYGSVVNDLARTLNYNLIDCESDQRVLERRVTERIPKELEPAFRNFLARKSQQLIDDVDGWLTGNMTSTTDPQDIETGQKDIRVGVGLYSILNDND